MQVCVATYILRTRNGSNTHTTNQKKWEQNTHDKPEIGAFEAPLSTPTAAAADAAAMEADRAAVDELIAALSCSSAVHVAPCDSTADSSTCKTGAFEEGKDGVRDKRGF